MKFFGLQAIVFLFLVLMLNSCKNDVKPQESVTANSEVEDTAVLFGQMPPSKTPVVFAPNVISKPDRYEFGCTMSKDGDEFYFAVDNKGKTEIYRKNLIDGKWGAAENILAKDTFSHNDPMLSINEDRLYFISDRPLEEGGDAKDIDIWYIERNGDEWSEPINAGNVINDDLHQYYCSFTQDGSMYFASKDKSISAPRNAFDIYKSKFVDGQFTTPEKLPKEINTEGYEADVFIAPDESYMVFSSMRRDGYGQGDLYVSFKNKKDNWTQAISMGETINTNKHELCPYVSKDGKYLFYTSNQDIYWVSADILDDYKTLALDQ